MVSRVTPLRTWQGLAALVLSVCSLSPAPSAQDRGLSAAADTASQWQPKRRLVVTIGIDKYSEWDELKTAVQDARGLVSLLSASGFRPLVPPLLDKNATRDAILDLFETKLPRVLNEDDDLVILFAGHGTSREATVAGRRTAFGFLVPAEAPAANKEEWSKYIPLGYFLEIIGALPARHILVILDSCRSGVALGRLVESGQGTSGATARARFSRRVISAADFRQDASDSGPVPGHSLFSGILIDGFQSGAMFPDRSHDVTDAEIAQFLRRRVSNASGGRQTPDSGRFSNDDFGEMVFAKPPPVPPPPPAPPPPPPVSTTPPSQVAGREALFGIDDPALNRGPAGKRPSRLAVVIGSDRYQELPSLQFAVADARGVGEALNALGYQVAIALNHTRDELVARLSSIAASASSNLASLVVFYAGHALQIRGRDYLALADTTMRSPQASALAFDELQDILARAGAQQKTFLIDAPFVMQESQLARMPSLRLDKGFRMLMPAPKTIPVENVALGHSLFSEALIRGLGGEAAGPDGLITFESLAASVEVTMRALSPQRARTQAVQALGSSPGNFPLGVIRR